MVYTLVGRVCAGAGCLKEDQSSQKGRCLRVGYRDKIARSIETYNMNPL